MKDMELLTRIFHEIEERDEAALSQFATKNREAKRQESEEPDYTRAPFALDRDKILYSGAYRRYQGKTQVIYFANMFDEEMSTRSLHTTYVSQISRTIGKMLGLNLDLIEAIALGHDLGHPPFGHDGETFLSELCLEHGIGLFRHNLHGLHIVDHIAKRGQGLNLTFQVRDGIVSHDGEVHNQRLIPDRGKTEEDLQDYVKRSTAGEDVRTMPATLEGCVVRISDTIAYIGQDIEDAIRANLVVREMIPHTCLEKLGDRNSRIIDTLVKSVVLSSYENDYIAFDEETSDELKKLKDFNYEFIYEHKNIKRSSEKIRLGFRLMFNKYLEDLEKHNQESKIFKHFLRGRSPDYIASYSYPEIVRDFIASMTDRYFSESLQGFILPDKVID